MKVAFQTLGCRVNVFDSEAMSEMFLRDGYELVNFDDVADVYVINTCTVTNMGDKKSRQYISKAKRQNPRSIVAVVGCYAQTNKEEIMGLEGVDVVLGSRNKSDIVFYVNKAMAEGKQVVHVTENLLLDHKFEELNVAGYEGKTRAFLKIQDGCNRFCSYCIIPYARGGISSKMPESILKEIRNLVDNGFKEVILSGIHVASYGQEFTDKMDLLDLLFEIEKIEGIERVRIGSIEPMFFKGERMEKILKLKKLCHHFHLSLQSGSNETLKRMNRRYTKEEYLDVVRKMRRSFPDVSITTDIIVGFPGETQSEFEETVDFLRELKLNKIHTFKYSPRKGTPAYLMKDQVDGSLKEIRSNVVIGLSEENENAYTGEIVGKIVEVLFEEGREDTYMGYTRNFIRVRVTSPNHLKGQLRQVRITGQDRETALGELLPLI